MLFKRLRKKERLTAVAVAKDAAASANGDKDVFEKLVNEDHRTKAIDPALILLFIRLVWLIWEYYKNKNASLPVDESAEDTVTAAIALAKE